MFGAFPLNQTLARNSLANPDDTLNTKRGLHRLGYYTPPTGEFNTWTDDAMFTGLTDFQGHHGLMKDGEMRKDGETANTLGNELAKRRAQQNPLREADEPPTEELDDNRPETRLGLFGPGLRAQQASDEKEAKPKSPPPPSEPRVMNAVLTQPSNQITQQRIQGRKRAAKFLGKLVRTGMTALSNSMAQAREPEPETPSLEDYQYVRGLKVDGIMNRGGETERTLTLDLRQNDVPDDPGQDDPEEPSEDDNPNTPTNPTQPSEPEEPTKPKEPKVDCGKLARDVENARLAIDDAQAFYDEAKSDLQQAQEEFEKLQEEYYKDLQSADKPSISKGGGSLIEKLKRLVSRGFTVISGIVLAQAISELHKAKKKAEGLKLPLQTATTKLAKAKEEWEKLRDEYAKHCRK